MPHTTSAQTSAHTAPNAGPWSTPGAAASTFDPRRRTGLTWMTSISAIDGTLVLLAANGAFHDLATAIMVGLTVIAGGGAWLLANEAYGHDATCPALGRLATTFIISTALTILAIAVGTHLAEGAPLRWLPKAGGASLLLIAGQTAGFGPKGAIGAIATGALVTTATFLELADAWLA